MIEVLLAIVRALLLTAASSGLPGKARDDLVGYRQLLERRLAE
jgi:hypothetical protein